MSAAAEVREAIDQIEQAYEFMLAYAAQGRQAETEPASQIRQSLARFKDALKTIAATLPQLLPADGSGQAFANRFADDAAVAQSVLDLLTAQAGISSDMIDNSNGLIAMRSLLTDLFFIDQVLLPARRGSPSEPSTTPQPS